MKAEKYLKLLKGHKSQCNYGYKKSIGSFVIKLIKRGLFLPHCDGNEKIS